MPGLAFYLGVGFAALGLIYTLVVLFARDPLFGSHRTAYVLNGIALCVLGVSLLGRYTFLPAVAVYALWVAAGVLAVLANRMIVATRGRS